MKFFWVFIMRVLILLSFRVILLFLHRVYSFCSYLGCFPVIPISSVLPLWSPVIPTWSILLLFLPGMFSVCSYWYILQGRADKTLLPVQAKPTDWICNCHLSHIPHIAYCDNIWAISDFSELYSQAWERDEGTGANQWKLPAMVSWPIQIAHRGQVSISYPPPLHTTPCLARARWLPYLPLPTSRWVSSNSTRDTISVDRCGRPALSLKLGNTGFSSLAHAKRLCLRSTGAAWLGGYCSGT